jgi:hypothetical protein
MDRNSEIETDAKLLLDQLRRSRFWGNVQLDFHDGEITLIRKTETFKPKMENNRQNNRHGYDR